MGSYLGLTTGVLTALVVILAATGACGRLAQMVGQPRVVGEMAAGILLGPTVFGALVPGVQQGLFTPGVVGVLNVLSTVGLTLFMFLIGAGIDHRHLDRRSARRAVGVAGAGLVLPLLFGVATGLLVAGALGPSGVRPWQFALFLGAALAVTAFPTLARILQERGMTSTPTGSLALVAAAIDDAAAWALLAVVVALAASGSASGAVVTVLGAAAFALLMLTVGRRLLARMVRRVDPGSGLPHGTVLVLVLVVLGCGWFTDLIGVHAVFGGFVAGLALPAAPQLRARLTDRLMDLNSVLLIPVYFVLAGLNTDLTGLLRPGLLAPALLVLLVAFAAKYLGCAAAVRLQGLSWRHGCAVGALMNARGLMILIFVDVGLAHGLIGRELYSVLVLAAIVTTAAALPLYRAAFTPRLEDLERHVDLPPAQTFRDPTREEGLPCPPATRPTELLK